MHKHTLRAAAIMAATALIAACGGGSTTTSAPTVGANPTPAGSAESSPMSSASAGQSIDATESDFKIDVSAASAQAGDVTFHVKNTAEQVHEFVIVKTDLAADKLPTNEDGTEVNEDADGLTVVDEIEDIEAGGSGDLDVNLEAGHYVLICNVPTHYQLGMHTEFTVGS